MRNDKNQISAMETILTQYTTYSIQLTTKQRSHFRLFQTTGVINVQRLCVEDRLSDLNNKPIEVSVELWIFIIPHFIMYLYVLRIDIPRIQFRFAQRRS